MTDTHTGSPLNASSGIIARLTHRAARAAVGGLGMLAIVGGTPTNAEPAFMATLREMDAALVASSDAHSAMRSTGPVSIAIAHIDAPVNGRAVPVYTRAEFILDVSGTWTNPFDPEQVRVDATVTTPSGRTLTVPGFFMTDFRRAEIDGREVLTATGQRGWRVRFTPTEPGEHTLTVTLVNAGQRAETSPLLITAVEPTSPPQGFVRISPQSPLHLAHDDGSLFFPIGLNVGWPSPGRGTLDYDRILANVAKTRGNTARVWLGPTFHSLCLETTPGKAAQGLDGALGWINQQAAWRFDHIVWLAEQHGLKLMPVSFSFSGFRSANGPSNWNECPYNAANGGPLTKPNDFFTDDASRVLAQRLLRYTVARWGHSTAVLCWELWNEVTGVDDYDREDSAAWHDLMATYLKTIDPYQHPVSTSVWWPEGDPLLDALPSIDFTMTHEYNSRDHGTIHHAFGLAKTARYAKPHFTGEFGNQEFDSGDSGVYGPERVSVHNVLWAGLTSGSAGGGLYWYWNIGDKDDWHRYFAPIAAFVDDLPLHTGVYTPISPVVRRAASDNTTATAASTSVATAPRITRLDGAPGSWHIPEIINRPVTVTLDPNGNIVGNTILPSVMHPPSKGELFNPVTINANFLRPGRAGVVIQTVSGWGGSQLEIDIDGVRALTKPLADTNANSTAEISDYNGEHWVDVPAGRHTITIRCGGPDWFRASFVLDGVTDDAFVPLWPTGLIHKHPTPGDLAAVVWLRHQDFNWGARRDGVPCPTITGAQVELPGLPAGSYSVEWFDTQTGRMVATPSTPTEAVVEVRNRETFVRLEVPPLTESIAAKVRMKQRVW